MELPEDPNKSNNFLVSRRAKEVSQVLADAARVARFSSRARSAAQGSSYVARRGDKLLQFIKVASLILIVIIPNIISILYFGLIASDQYVSEAKFTVASGAIPKMDGLGSVTGLPPMAIFQDSNIIINYIESRALVDALDPEINLRKKYSSDDIDWWSRFNKEKPVEKLLDYWRDHVKATITAPAGIIKLEVWAFSPTDARDIINAVIAKCEALVNSLNNKMRSDMISLAEIELRRSGERLKNVRMKVETVRNQEGMINAIEASEALTNLLVNLETQLLKAKNEYETAKKYVNETAPQLRFMKSKIDTLSFQITDVKSKLTTKDSSIINADKANSSALKEGVLSKKITNISEVELEQKISETSYVQASTSLEVARQMSEKKMIYLHQITQPDLAEDASYPRRKLSVLICFIASLAVFLFVYNFSQFSRDHLA